jgi:hypothetical protein
LSAFAARASDRLSSSCASFSSCCAVRISPSRSASAVTDPAKRRARAAISHFSCASAEYDVDIFNCPGLRIEAPSHYGGCNAIGLGLPDGAQGCGDVGLRVHLGNLTGIAKVLVVLTGLAAGVRIGTERRRAPRP